MPAAHAGVSEWIVGRLLHELAVHFVSQLRPLQGRLKGGERRGLIWEAIIEIP